MRTKNELIDIMIFTLINDEDRIGECETIPGLCALINNSNWKEEERCIMRSLIYTNRPDHAIGRSYFFPPYQLQPRIDFLHSLKDPSPNTTEL
jgi:hypothetical protein